MTNNVPDYLRTSEIQDRNSRHDKEKEILLGSLTENVCSTFQDFYNNDLADALMEAENNVEDRANLLTRMQDAADVIDKFKRKFSVEYITGMTKFVALMSTENMTASQAYKLAYPKEYNYHKDRGITETNIASIAGKKKKSPLYLALYERTNTHEDVIYAPYRKEVVEVAMSIVRNTESREHNRLKAVELILVHTKKPEAVNVEVNNNNVSIEDNKDESNSLNQLASIAAKINTLVGNLPDDESKGEGIEKLINLDVTEL